MEAVLDANIFIYAVFDGRGPERALFRLEKQGRFTNVVNHAIVDEVWRVMAREFTRRGLPMATFFDVTKDFARLLATSRSVRSKTRHQVVAEDPDDDKYFTCAIEGNVPIIVTNDWDHVGPYDGKCKTLDGRSIRVLRPAQFGALLVGGDRQFKQFILTTTGVRQHKKT